MEIFGVRTEGKEEFPRNASQVRALGVRGTCTVLGTISDFCSEPLLFSHGEEHHEGFTEGDISLALLCVVNIASFEYSFTNST